MNRRTFSKYLSGSLIALLSGVTIPLMGCSAIDDLKNWIPVALSSLAAIIKLLGPLVPAPVAAIIVLIQSGFSALLTAIQNYQAGGGVLADVTNAIAAVESAFASFFQSLSVPSTLLNLIEGLAGIILSTMSAFAAEISPSASLPKATLNHAQITYTPKKRSVRKYRSDWNSLCIQSGHKEAEI